MFLQWENNRSSSGNFKITLLTISNRFHSAMWLYLEMDKHIWLEIIIHFIEWLACINSKDFSKLFIVMASPKESLTSAKTLSLPDFLFCGLSVYISEAIIRSSISLSSILTCKFIVSFTILRCVFGDVSIFRNVSINCVIFNDGNRIALIQLCRQRTMLRQRANP